MCSPGEVYAYMTPFASKREGLPSHPRWSGKNRFG